MAKISKCPECGDSVLIPATVVEDQMARCPLCDAEFKLADILAEAEDAPPALVLLGGQVASEIVDTAGEPAAGESDAEESAEEQPNGEPEEKPEHADSDAESTAEDKAEHAEPDPESASDATKDAVDFSFVTGDQPKSGEGEADQAGEEPSGFKLWDDVSEAPKIDTGVADDEESEGGEGFQFGGVVTGEDDEEADEETSSVGARKKSKKEKSAVKEIVGIVLGGFGGVLLAYYGLNLFGGPRFDFAEVYLPGIQHTVRHRPPWWPGWLSFESEPDSEEVDIDAELDKIIAMEPDSSAADSSAPDSANGDGGSKPDAAQAVESAGDVSAEQNSSDKPPVEVPAGFIRLSSRPHFDADELGKALKAAHNVFGCPRCNSTGEVSVEGKEVDCPDCQGHPPDAMTPAAYSKFCRLAEVIAFVENAPGGNLAARKKATADLLHTVGKKPENVIEIGRLASSVLDHDNRDTSGILLSGTVKATAKHGDVQTATVKLAGIERNVTLASQGPLGLKVKDRLLALGSLVVDDQDSPIEHAADEPLVWMGLCETFKK